MRPFLRGLLLLALLSPGPLHAQTECDSLTQQLTAADHDLDALQQTATPLLEQAAPLGAVAAADLLGAADRIPGETAELAAVDAAALAQVGVLAEQAASQSLDHPADTFFTDLLADSLPAMETSLAQVQRVLPLVQSAQVLQGLVRDLRLTASKAQASLRLRDDLSNRLRDCQKTADPCPLSFMRADLSTPAPRLRPLWSVRDDEAVVLSGGGQWDVHFMYPADAGTSGPSIVEVVDTFRCTDGGLEKVGRQAVQTFSDASTAAWGEQNYQGVLYPRVLPVGAQWDWTAVQWSGDPNLAAASETWHTHVVDAGRQTVTWPDGRYEVVHLQVTTVTDTDTFSSDEYLARRLT